MESVLKRMMVKEVYYSIAVHVLLLLIIVVSFEAKLPVSQTIEEPMKVTFVTLNMPVKKPPNPHITHTPNKETSLPLPNKLSDKGNGAALSSIPRVENEPERKEKKELGQFDELLTKAAQKINHYEQANLSKTSIKKHDNYSEYNEGNKVKGGHKDELIDAESEIIEEYLERAKARDAAFLEEEEEVVMDPLFFHQQELIYELKKQMRVGDEYKGATCRLHLLISQDGMVIEAERVRGNRFLCDEAKKASIRLGKISKIEDPEVYEYLKDINLDIKM